MNPSVEAFDEVKYKALMDGVECSEVPFSEINLGDRIDSDYYTKKYLHISKLLANVTTKKLGSLAYTVASAFYPAATQLYSEGDTPFARCVDCVSYPVITKNQDSRFEKIPYSFGRDNKGISFVKTNDIIVTKVGTPCYASILCDYEEIALSRTVLGLTAIHNIDPYYLMVFLRCKYGFEQLYRQRELTIQYQLTLPRVKALDIYIASDELQQVIKTTCESSKECRRQADRMYQHATEYFMSFVDIGKAIGTSTNAVKSYSESFKKTGRLDAEFYQPKYDSLFQILSTVSTRELGGTNGIVTITKSIEPGSDAYGAEGIPFIRVSDISKYEITEPDVKLNPKAISCPEKHFVKKGTILFSKDGSVGIAYKIEADLNAITSGALLHLTVRNPMEVLPDYLTLVLNSPIVQLQAERYSNGAIIQHWKPSEIEKVVIPMLNIEIQKEISSKVLASFALRKRSKLLFEYAKEAVELAIEKDESTALVWLNKKLSEQEY